VFQPNLELYELDHGGVLAFAGTRGDRGVLTWGGSGWTFHARGSLTWDDLHQAVYRNHRATSLAAFDLANRGIPTPPPGLVPETPQSVTWEEQFASQVPLQQVRAEVLQRLRANGPAPLSVHLIMVEDQYESTHGDGVFLYAKAAFWDAQAAAEQAQTLRATQDPVLGNAYHRKSIALRVDEGRGVLVANLNLAQGERCSIQDVLRLL